MPGGDWSTTRTITPVLLLTSALVIGFLGSAHCVGMCGGLVVALHHGRANPARRQAFYFGGKTLAYAGLGAMAGGLGALAGFAFAGAQGVLSLAMGAVLIAAGLATCGLWRRSAWGTPGAVALLARPIGRLVASDRDGAVLALGVLNGLLPCGLVYAMLAHAAALGNAFQGALVLAAFGVGTVPALVLVGTLGGRLPVSRRLWMQRAAGGLVVALGVLTLTRAAMALNVEALLALPGAGRAVVQLCLPGS